jgi:hypothetical protein
MSESPGIPSDGELVTVDDARQVLRVEPDIFLFFLLPSLAAALGTSPTVGHTPLV